MQEHQVGWFAEAGNSKMIVSVLTEIINAKEIQLELYSKNARKLAEDKFNKEVVLNKFNDLFS